MPLVIQFTGPYAAPKILCDHCGKEIMDAKDGNYQWTHEDGCAEGQTTTLYFTHKACCDAFEHTHGDPYAWARLTWNACRTSWRGTCTSRGSRPKRVRG